MRHRTAGKAGVCEELYQELNRYVKGPEDRKWE
jgi:hypothetical protein